MDADWIFRTMIDSMSSLRTPSLTHLLCTSHLYVQGSRVLKIDSLKFRICVLSNVRQLPL